MLFAKFGQLRRFVFKPDHSIPPRFRIQGGGCSPECYGGGRTEILVSNIGFTGSRQRDFPGGINGCI